jgi:tetratricopeptide (TPR) repeat protein
MRRFARFMLLMVALAALASAGALAQATAAVQKPPDTKAAPGSQARETQAAQAKPEEAELPPDYKAFNEIAGEKDAGKRAAAYEKWIADNPESALVSTAKNEIQRIAVAAYKDASKKYLEVMKAQVDLASGPNAFSTYNRVASQMLRDGAMLEEAEKYARTGLSMMDEQKYIDARKEAASSVGRSPQAAGAAASRPPGISITASKETGAPIVSLRPRPATPAAATARPPSAPRVPSDDDLRRTFRSQKASAQATLGQILFKQGKTDEAEKVLKEAYDAAPPASTLATIARTLAECAKKDGDDKGQLEYLTVVALSGRITADEQKEFEGVYRKTHGGTLDGLDGMLDERYRHDHPPLDLGKYTRKAGPAPRAVLAELFSGSG